VFLAEMASAVESAFCVGWVEVDLFLRVSGVSGDFLRCHCGKQVTWAFGCDEALPGGFLLQPSPCYAKETQHPASSLLGLQGEVS